MKKINIKMVVSIILIGLFLSACNSKSSGSTPVENTLPQCGTDADMGKSNAIDVTGKTIQKTDMEAEVRIWHSSDGIKTACIISGDAKII